jgi:hypothetical protein
MDWLTWVMLAKILVLAAGLAFIYMIVRETNV